MRLVFLLVVIDVIQGSGLALGFRESKEKGAVQIG